MPSGGSSVGSPGRAGTHGWLLESFCLIRAEISSHQNHAYLIQEAPRLSQVLWLQPTLGVKPGNSVINRTPKKDGTLGPS